MFPIVAIIFASGFLFGAYVAQDKNKEVITFTEQKTEGVEK